jgi:hypothetical protein
MTLITVAIIMLHFYYELSHTDPRIFLNILAKQSICVFYKRGVVMDSCNHLRAKCHKLSFPTLVLQKACYACRIVFYSVLCSSTYAVISSIYR